MKIQPRARYNQSPYHGLIRASLYSGKTPVEYTIKLYDERTGILKLANEKVRTLAKAKGVASLHGFDMNQWDVVECEV